MLFNFAVSRWVKKNLARLKGGNILSLCINTQPVMIKLLRKWTTKHYYRCSYFSDGAKLKEFKNDKLLLSVVSEDHVWQLPGN